VHDLVEDPDIQSGLCVRFQLATFARAQSVFSTNLKSEDIVLPATQLRKLGDTTLSVRIETAT
jgi:hypothetical protein